MSRVALVCAAAFGALTLTAHAATPVDSRPTDTPHYGAWGFDEKGEDRAVKPGDDFSRPSSTPTPIPPSITAASAA